MEEKYRLEWISKSFNMNRRSCEGSLKEIEKVLQHLDCIAILSLTKVETK